MVERQIHKTSLCWDCDNEVFWECPWVVKGILPENCSWQEHEQPGYQNPIKYVVTDCPKFKKQKPSKKPKSEVLRPLKIPKTRKQRAPYPKESWYTVSQKIQKLAFVSDKVIEEYNSINEAAALNNIARRTLQNALHGEDSWAAGYRWRIKGKKALPCRYFVVETRHGKEYYRTKQNIRMALNYTNYAITKKIKDGTIREEIYHDKSI